MISQWETLRIFPAEVESSVPSHRPPYAIPFGFVVNAALSSERSDLCHMSFGTLGKGNVDPRLFFCRIKKSGFSLTSVFMTFILRADPRDSLHRGDVSSLKQLLHVQVSRYVWVMAHSEAGETLEGAGQGLWHLPLVFAKLQWSYFLLFLGNCHQIDACWLRSLVGSQVVGLLKRRATWKTLLPQSYW